VNWLAATAGCWLGGAALVWLVRRWSGVSVVLSVGATLAGAGCLGAAALGPLTGDSATWQVPWGLPFGTFAVRLDPLAAVFLAPIALIGALGAIYAPGYLRLGRHRDAIGSTLAAYPLLLATMALVVVAANTVLLLMGWELMTMVSWYMLTRHHQAQEVRSAGLSYLIAGHVSGGALLLLFVFLSQTGAGWLIPTGPLSIAGGAPAGLLLGLILIGFGTKAAIVPLHVWLPDAHAAAPSHVSALMSGVLITLGFYGIARFVPLLGPLPPAWGIAVMGLGALGACGGIVMALSQRDVKRVLAYSTIENAGLVTLAIGAAWLATALGHPAVAALAWTAALLHLWNHAVSKSLLFFTAGAIAEVVHDRELERWGGLLRRLPLLATPLLVGAAGVVGLPGTHGFASEWLLLMSLFRGSQELVGPARLVMLLGVVAVAFTAGAAVAAFVRLVGVGLLGHPRSRAAAEAVSPSGGGWLAIPALGLAVLCFALVAVLQPLLELLGRAVEQLVPAAEMSAVEQLAAPLPWLAVALLGGVTAVALGRIWLRWRRPARAGVTWDCGYAQPAPTMQYTASSLSQPITRVLQPALHTAVRWTPPRALMPGALEWESRTPERALAEIYRPAFVRLAQLLGFFTRFQEGQVMVYLRYVGVALLVLLAWLFLPVELTR
jgi:formate hydrogenlyase subunit 3/multisubunit Na+/H+ antiporter MnhD subunit